MEPIKQEVVEPIKPVFKKPSIVGIMTWMGTIIAIVSAIAYLIIVYILVRGFSTNVESNKLFVFLALGAADGVLISSALRFQGVSFAKALPPNQDQIKVYTELLGKSKSTKLRPLWYMYLINSIVDIVVKGGSILFTMFFTISIMIEGMQDDKYFVLGIINVLMYMGLGLLALGKGYDYYNERQVPYLEQRITVLKEEKANELISKTETECSSIVRTSDRGGGHQEAPGNVGLDQGSGSIGVSDERESQST